MVWRTELLLGLRRVKTAGPLVFDARKICGMQSRTKSITSGLIVPKEKAIYRSCKSKKVNELILLSNFWRVYSRSWSRSLYEIENNVEFYRGIKKAWNHSRLCNYKLSDYRVSVALGRIAKEVIHIKVCSSLLCLLSFLWPFTIRITTFFIYSNVLA